jgi:outer membrane murein-binding lipoprotein Lpp
MKKLLAAVIVSTVALSGVSALAADTAKRDDLTQTQRADMRDRADQLTRARANGTEQKTAQAEAVPVTKKHTTKTHKSTKHTTKKVEPKS